MNNLAFQIYGLKKNVFQSTWKTDNIGVYVELAGSATASLNWSGTAFSSGYTHIPGVGNTTPLSTSISAISGRYYQIKYTVTGTAGSVTINYGGTSNIVSTYNSEVTITVLTTSTSSLSILPTFDFNGNVKISLKQYVSSIATQVKLPLIGGNYNFWVDWGDGQYNNVTNANYTTSSLHNYSVAGTYTIRISGDIAGWNFGDTGDKLKILTISSWGKLRLQGYGEYFKGCVNLSLSGLTDVLDLSTTTTLLSMFASCVNITTIPRINEWDTSKVTAMGSMFYVTNFDGDISNWNVSKVVSFYDMFGSASKFNNGGSSGINNWLINTASSVDMTKMFNGASKFNQPLDLWNVTKVTSMSQMFQYCTIFNQSLNNWERTTIGNTSTLANVINMSFMFYQAPAFNSNIGTWDVSKVTSFASMFNGASNFNNGDDSAPINNWNINTVSNVSMESMFKSANAFNRPIDNWYMTKVNNTSYMFYGNTAFNQSLSNWERVGSTLANVTNMSGMFYNAIPFNQNLSNWNVSGVQYMGEMFRSTTGTPCLFNNGQTPSTIGTNPLTWTTTSLLDCSNMFYGHYNFNQDISSWDVSKVTVMNGMFYHDNGPRTFTFNNGGGNIPLTWNTSACTNMAYMFTRTAFNQCIGNWNVNKVTSFDSMFFGCAVFNNGDNSVPMNNWNINTTSPVSMTSMFHASGFNQDISGWNVSKVTSFASMFNSATAFNNGSNTNINPITGLQGINGWNINTVSNVNMSAMFAGASVFNRDLGNWNVTKVTDMNSMFYNAYKFNKNIGTWERVDSTMANVTNLYQFMCGYNAIMDFNNDGSSSINNWNTSGVTNMANAFMNNLSLNQPLNNWNTANVTDMSQMFNMWAGNSVFNQDLGSWNTANVTNMSVMFYNAKMFNKDLSLWNVNKVVNMSGMFQFATAFDQNIGNWNVSSVTNFTSFMAGKTNLNFLSTNLDAIYNGWIVNGVKPNISISFGTAKYSQAGKPGKDTLLASPNNWTITDGLLNVSGTSNNGGLIRVTTTAAHGFTTGNSVYIYGVNGTTNANGTWTVTVVSSTVIELQGSTYNAAWTSGGNVILG